MPKIQTGSKGKLVWAGRPSVSVFYLLYGIVALTIIVVLLILELWFSASSLGASVIPRTIALDGTVIPYPVELLTVTVILLAYFAKVLSLALVRARYKYELYEDGLYVDSGIVNLQNTFLSPMAFSDARLVQDLSMRMVKRGLIIVEANDGRKFNLMLVEKPQVVQELIRRTLAHPVVRVESRTDPEPPTDE